MTICHESTNKLNSSYSSLPWLDCWPRGIPSKKISTLVFPTLTESVMKIFPASCHAAAALALTTFCTCSPAKVRFERAHLPRSSAFVPPRPVLWADPAIGKFERRLVGDERDVPVDRVQGPKVANVLWTAISLLASPSFALALHMIVNRFLHVPYATRARRVGGCPGYQRYPHAIPVPKTSLFVNLIWVNCSFLHKREWVILLPV